MASGDRLERAAAKGALATSLAGVGFALGGPVGGVIGGLTGLIVGDQPIVLQMDYIAVPAYEFSALLQGQEPSHRILLKEGEMIAQVQPTEAQETEAILETSTKPKKRRKKSAWNIFVASYIKAYHKGTPKGKKTNATLMKEAARKWKSHKRGKK